jgi:hypothetical protein
MTIGTVSLVISNSADAAHDAELWTIPKGDSGAMSPNLGTLTFESWAKESFEIATKIAYRRAGDWDSKGWDGLRDGRRRLPCFLWDTWLVQAGLLIGG